MRRISMSFLALALLAGPALAEVPQRLGCKSYARVVADEWSVGYIEVADEGTTAAEDQVLFIGSGREYYVPRKMTGIVDSGYFRIRKRNQVFWDAFNRCMEGGNVSITLPPPGVDTAD
jgi:hypothetical protein